MDTISIDLLFDAPQPVVWRAWTEPRIIREWFGSNQNGNVNSVDIDLRINGTYSISFQDGDGTAHTCFGVYTTILPPKELAFTWEWKSEPGHESRVHISLADEGSKTRMKFSHSGLNSTSAHNYLEGWKSTFRKLDRIVSEIS